MKLGRKVTVAAVCAAFGLAAFSAYAQTATRSTLNSYNNTYITSNNRGAITGPILNSMNSQFISNMGVLNDTNSWTGANTFSGTLGFGNSSQARGAMGAAASGANGDITSLTIPGVAASNIGNLGSGHVFGNATSAPALGADASLLSVMQQSGSGLGSGVATAASYTINTTNGLLAGLGAAALNLGWVSVTASPYNADPTGATDSTAAFTNASASGAAVVWVPPGTYKVCGATMSSTFNQVLLGAFSLSKIVQGNCGSPAIGWNQTSNVYSEQTIADLGFDSTAGTNHTINTTGAAGLTMRNLYFTNTPAGYDNIYVNGAASVAAHDMKADNIQVYAVAGGPHGNAMIECGAYCADSDFNDSVGNGDFLTAYGLKIDSGATTIRVARNHLYNLSTGALYVTGCSNCQFFGDTWDNVSAGDIATLSNVQNSSFTGEQIESINSGRNGITISGSSQANTFTGTIFGVLGGSTANYAVNETSGNYNRFLAGTVSGINNYVSPVIHLTGANSYLFGFGGVPNEGLPLSELAGFGSGVATAAGQATNSTNGLLAGPGAAATNGAVPHVANLTALQSYSTSYGNIVHRDGYATAGDGGGADYIYSSSACTFNLGRGDNGSQVQANGGGCWIAQFGAGSRADIRVWGASTALTDNGPAIDASMAWCASLSSGCELALPAGQFKVASTFDCHYASSMYFHGAGNETQIYRTGNYGHTFTCGGSTKQVESVHVADLFFLQDLGSGLPATAVNLTTGFGSGYDALGSAHIVFRNLSHSLIERVTAWNLNFNYECIDCIDVTYRDEKATGIWNGSTINQTKANFYIDGADSDYPTGHPQLIEFQNDLTNGYQYVGSQTFGSGWTAHTVSNAVAEAGAYDDILIKSCEGCRVSGGQAFIGAYHANIELRPQGVAGKPIYQTHIDDKWLDGAGTADLVIDNADSSSCTNPNSQAASVQVNGGLWNGEYATYYGVLIPQNSCASVTGFQINDVETVAHIATPYKILGASGGGIHGGSSRNYNVYGYNFSNVAESSATWIAGNTANFSVDGLAAGGNNVFGEPATSTVGVATVVGGGTGWSASGTGTATWAGGGCSTNPIINISTNATGVMATTGISIGGSCQIWPNSTATTWTISGVTGGSLPQIALGVPYSEPDQSHFGVSLSGGLTNVKRTNVHNIGYYEDYPTNSISCAVGTGSPTYVIGADNREFVIVTNPGSGSVTSGSCSFFGSLSNYAVLGVTSSDAQTSAGTPVLSAITTTNPGGFTFNTSASIGGGGKITFTIKQSD